MRNFITVLFLLFCAFNSALADSNLNVSENFAGPAVAIGLSSVGTNSDFKYNGSTQNLKYSLGENHLVGTLNLSYLKDISDKWLIGGGLAYDLNSLKDENINYFDSSLGGYNTTIRIKRHLSVYAQPTYALNESTAIFFKAAYHQAKIDIRDNYIYSIKDYKDSLHGFGIGVGAMIFLTKDVFTKLEIEKVSYSRVNIPYGLNRSINYKLSTTTGTVSIGYRF